MYIFDSKCSKCLPLGVRCVDTGLISMEPANTGETVIYLDGLPVLRTMEATKDCPAVLDESKQEAVVAKIKENASKSKRIINIDNFGNY